MDPNDDVGVGRRPWGRGNDLRTAYLQPWEYIGAPVRILLWIPSWRCFPNPPLSFSYPREQRRAEKEIIHIHTHAHAHAHTHAHAYTHAHAQISPPLAELVSQMLMSPRTTHVVPISQCPLDYRTSNRLRELATPKVRNNIWNIDMSEVGDWLSPKLHFNGRGTACPQWAGIRDLDR